MLKIHCIQTTIITSSSDNRDSSTVIQYNYIKQYGKK